MVDASHIHKLRQDVQDALEAVALEVKTMSGGETKVQQPALPGGTVIVHMVHARTYYSGFVKEEGDEIPLFALFDTPDEAASSTIQQLQAMVSGSVLYWRVKPQMISQRGEMARWYSEMDDYGIERCVSKRSPAVRHWTCRLRMGLDPG